MHLRGITWIFKSRNDRTKLWFDSSLAIQRKSNILQIYAPPTFSVLASFIDCCYYLIFFWLPRPTHVLSSTNTQSLGVTSCSPNPLFFPFKQLNEQTRVLNDSFIFLVQLQYVEDGYFSLKRYDCRIGGRCGHDQLFCLLGICDDVIGKKKKIKSGFRTPSAPLPSVLCRSLWCWPVFLKKKEDEKSIERHVILSACLPSQSARWRHIKTKAD